MSGVCRASLTAVVFVGAVPAVVVPVTHPDGGDAPLVGAAEVAGGAGGGDSRGAVDLVRAVATVVVAVAFPRRLDAVVVVAGERVRGAGRSWKEGNVIATLNLHDANVLPEVCAPLEGDLREKVSHGHPAGY